MSNNYDYTINNESEKSDADYACESEENKKWLAGQDSNLRIRVPKTRVLPLDDRPV